MQFCWSWKKDTDKIRKFSCQSLEKKMKFFFRKHFLLYLFFWTRRKQVSHFCWKNLIKKPNVFAHKSRMINKCVVFPEKKHTFRRSCGDIERIFENKVQKSFTKSNNVCLKIMNWWKKFQKCTSKRNVPLDT